MLTYPEGCILEHPQTKSAFLLYGEFDKTSFVTKGWHLEVPNLNLTTNAQKNELCIKLQSLLTRFDSNKRLQFRFERNTNYDKVLDDYESDTEKLASNAFVKEYRQNIAKQFRNELKDGKIWKEGITLYISMNVSQFINGNISLVNKEEVFEFINQVDKAFNFDDIILKEAFNFPTMALSAFELFKDFYKSVNLQTSYKELDNESNYQNSFEDIYKSDYYFDDSLVKNKNHQNIISGNQIYWQILKLKTLPAIDLWPFYGNGILFNRINNFKISVNVKPITKESTISKLESRQAAARRDLEADPSAIAYKAEVDQLEDTIYRMGRDGDVPFEIEYFITLWNKDLEQLTKDTEQIKLIATNLHLGLYSYTKTIQTCAEFLKTLPGNLFYKKWDPLLVLHKSFAAILPFNSSFTGCTQKAHALFHGDHNNIVSINGFIGNTPQHAATFGQSGSGKSVNTLGELLQSCIHYSKIVIIEEGASYLMFTRILAGQYVELDLNNSVILNYFDTASLPLDANQLDFATRFASEMCGTSNNCELEIDRQSIISYYVNLLYQSNFYDWIKKNPTMRLEVIQTAIILQHLKEKEEETYKTNSSTTLVELYSKWNEIKNKSAELLNNFELEILNFSNKITLKDLNNFDISNSEMVRNTAYAFMKPEEMPCHSQLLEIMRSTPESCHDKNLLKQITNRLARYSIESGRGCLFDGTTNISLKNPILHFEIGKIANADANLKGMAALVISNLIRGQIINMPRSQKKLYIFEEAPRFLTLPGAADIMKQSYAQFRKFNCRAWTITQCADQLTTYENCGSIIMSQSKQYYLLKNKDEENLRFFSSFLSLSKDTLNAIKTFPSPEFITGKKYSSFIYYCDDDLYPKTGVIRHYANNLALAVASTNGEDFVKREAELLKIKEHNPSFDAGLLLLEYIKRKNLSCKALLILEEMIKEKSFNKIDLLKEEITSLLLRINYLETR